MKAATTASEPIGGAGLRDGCGDGVGDAAFVADGVGFGAVFCGADLAGNGVDPLTFVVRDRGVVVDEFEFCALTT